MPHPCREWRIARFASFIAAECTEADAVRGNCRAVGRWWWGSERRLRVAEHRDEPDDYAAHALVRFLDSGSTGLVSGLWSLDSPRPNVGQQDQRPKTRGERPPRAPHGQRVEIGFVWPWAPGLLWREHGQDIEPADLEQSGRGLDGEEDGRHAARLPNAAGVTVRRGCDGTPGAWTLDRAEPFDGAFRWKGSGRGEDARETSARINHVVSGVSRTVWIPAGLSVSIHSTGAAGSARAAATGRR
jgi:hypothetical protein